MGFAEENGIDCYFGDENISNYYDLGRFYHDNYNLATIGEAKWKTADKKEMSFKDMEEKHILNCIRRFNKYHVLVGVFKLELLRRKLFEKLSYTSLADIFAKIENEMSYEDYTGKYPG